MQYINKHTKNVYSARLLDKDEEIKYPGGIMLVCAGQYVLTDENNWNFVYSKIELKDNFDIKGP